MNKDYACHVCYSTHEMGIGISGNTWEICPQQCPCHDDVIELREPFRPRLEDIYMELAIMLSYRSTCKRAKVGCVITSSNLEQVYSIGYNGTAKGFPNDDCLNIVGGCGCVHAEDNAMAKLGVRDPDKIFFVTTTPCIIHAKVIINTGASKFYYEKIYRESAGLNILKKAGIEVEQL